MSHQKRRCTAVQELSERQQTMERVMKNGLLYKKVVLVVDFLLKGSTNKSDLLKLVIPVIREHGMHVERVLRRNKQAIYCWICENIHLFPDIESMVQIQWPFESINFDAISNDTDTLTDPDPLEIDQSFLQETI